MRILFNWILYLCAMAIGTNGLYALSGNESPGFFTSLSFGVCIGLSYLTLVKDEFFPTMPWHWFNTTN